MDEQSSANATENTRSRWVRIGGAVVAVIVLIAAFRFLPLQTYLESFLAWVQGLGVWGGVILGIAYIIATIAFVPGSILTLGAGYVYGVVWGTVIVSIASTVGAALAFLAGRFFARDFVRKIIDKYPTFKAVDSALDKEAFKVVFLLRLVPLLPFNVLNYAFGLSGVTFTRYFFASWIGMLPATIMYVYFGSLAEKVTRLAAGQPEASVPVWDVVENVRRAFAGEFGNVVAQNLFYWLGLIATIAVTVVVTRKARAELEKLTEESEEIDSLDDIGSAGRG